MERNLLVAMLLSITAAYLEPRFAVAFSVSDPLADTIGAPNIAHDISMVEAIIGSDALIFNIELSGMISPASAFADDSIVGYIDLDLDQEETTGETSNFSQFLALLEGNGSSESSGLGSELYVDLFSERFTPGQFEVVDAATRTVIGTATGSYSSNSFQVGVPLSLLGNDPILSYAVVVGDFVDLSDGLVGRTIPEPSAFIASLVALVLTSAAPRRQFPR